MIDTIYIEEAVREHPRTQAILARFPKARQIKCKRYSEVFNPKAQNFRLQKQNPSLILAEKFHGHLQEAPLGYGIGASKNYYFSHMLNCLYDCRYCFLQGMYHSAHYILFVNYEDFHHEISKIIANHSKNEEIHFFSGYDCDSLALEPATDFAANFLNFFATLPDNALLELRTKSTQVRSLLEREPLENCVVAFSFTPDGTAKALEHKAPNVQRRLDALKKIQDKGWKIGLRFDPMIYQKDYRPQYETLFEAVFEQIDPALLHSVNLGVFRLPDNFFKKLRNLYPDEILFASPMESTRGMMAYKQEIEEEMTQYCQEQLLRYIPSDKYFPCTY
jgi:spore photoproduct lyase